MLGSLPHVLVLVSLQGTNFRLLSPSGLMMSNMIDQFPGLRKKLVFRRDIDAFCSHSEKLDLLLWRVEVFGISTRLQHCGSCGRGYTGLRHMQGYAWSMGGGDGDETQSIATLWETLCVILIDRWRWKSLQIPRLKSCCESRSMLKTVRRLSGGWAGKITK